MFYTHTFDVSPQNELKKATAVDKFYFLNLTNKIIIIIIVSSGSSSSRSNSSSSNSISI